MRVDVFRKPQPPRVQENMGLHLETLWDVICFRKSPAGQQYAPHPLLPSHHVYLAELRFGDATMDVERTRFDRLPLSPVWKNFVRLAETQNVEREALSLAILLQHGGVTFRPGKVAPIWTSQQCVNAGFAQETHDEDMLLLLYARVLEDLDAFFADVNKETALRAKKAELTQPNDRADEEKTAETRVPWGRLRKARDLFLRARGRPATDLLPRDKHYLLVSCLTRVCPSWIAVLRGKLWYAGGHRVRGLDPPSGVHRVLLFNPKPGPHTKKTIASCPP